MFSISLVESGIVVKSAQSNAGLCARPDAAVSDDGRDARRVA